MDQVLLYRQFAANLEAACRDRGISQLELARRSGLHPVTVNRIIRGNLQPKLSTCQTLAAAVGVDAGKLFSQTHVDKLSVPR